jgi:5-methylcytosine-specific restriction endonuclease McrA
MNPEYRRSIKRRLYEAQSAKCCHCGLHMEYNLSTIDHVIPYSKGGRGWRNLLLAHRRCNENRANKPPTQNLFDWLTKVSDVWGDVVPPNVSIANHQESG